MDIWNSTCMKAFDGDHQADESLKFIQQHGHMNLEENTYIVTVGDIDEQQQYPTWLQSLGFTQHSTKRNTYTLPGEMWRAFDEAKRKNRMNWHSALQQRLSQQLKETLDRIQDPLVLTHGQRLVLVKEFARNHAKDVGSIPFLRGLVGCLRAQLYKRSLVDWQVVDYVITQNGQDAMVDYIRLVRGVLGLTLVARKDSSHNGDMVAVNMTETTETSFHSPHTTAPVVDAASSAVDDDHYMIWRMNPALSDQDLTDFLECLPRQQCNQLFPCSPIARNASLLPSSFILRCISLFFRRCLSLLPF